MPKNRSTVYTVVREFWHKDVWIFSGLIGTYLTLSRADEVASKTVQEYVDRGMSKTNAEYRCTVKPSTWYEE